MLCTLGEGIDELESVMPHSKEYKLMRDGTIQRFEYCIDSFWKFIKIYLEIYQKMTIEASSPRSILKQALKIKIISNKKCTILLDCISDRNLTSHTYDEETAEKIQSFIPAYYEVMRKIIERLHP